MLIEGSCAAEGVTDQKNGYLIKEDAVFLAKILKFAMKISDAVRRVGERAMSDLYLSWEESIDRAYERYLYIYEKYTGMRRHSAVKREQPLQGLPSRLIGEHLKGNNSEENTIKNMQTHLCRYLLIK